LERLLLVRAKRATRRCGPTIRAWRRANSSDHAAIRSLVADDRTVTRVWRQLVRRSQDLTTLRHSAQKDVGRGRAVFTAETR
jgi:hypothetical protein